MKPLHGLRIALRVDASLLMGSGHLMRCLTLAEALRARGAHCQFITREHPGHLLAVIQSRKFEVKTLKNFAKPAWTAIKTIDDDAGLPAHAAWLGTDWQTDAKQTAAALQGQVADWLVVDHYALDQRWEQALAPHYRRLLVIDDLADRPHCADLLLDQNLGRAPQDYAALVPAHCKLLIGPQYALLRPEFAALRPYSLARRQKQPAMRQLLITMGGVDQFNATGQVLQALQNCRLPPDCRITVVMGLNAPHLEAVRDLAAQMHRTTEVLVNISDMAQRMADSDLAIGAAGSTSWERCCLGLPTLMVVLADNQLGGALALARAQAARLIGTADDIAAQLPRVVEDLRQGEVRAHMSAAANKIADGCGLEKICSALEPIDG